MKNYIDAKTFLEQSEKVQRVFMEWWIERIKIGDLFNYGDLIRCIQGEYKIKDIKDKKERYIPLLQLHQLIDFIEEKTNTKTEICFLFEDEAYRENIIGYCIYFYNDETGVNRWYNVESKSKIECLWKTACKIVENNGIGEKNEYIN